MTKIQRNDQCPCGSGKKYKKCCLNSNSYNDIDSEFTSEDLQLLFADPDNPLNIDEKKVEKVISLFNEYHFEDLIVSVFAINAWRSNRSALSQCMTLNKALLAIKEAGAKRITCYHEFKELFDKLKKILPITPLDDLCLNDFGEIHVNFKDKPYPIITGTGHQQVYANARFLTNITSFTNTDDELQTILTYQEEVITALRPANIKKEENSIGFEVPSIDFLNVIQSLFEKNSFQSLAGQVWDILHNPTLPMEKTHFLKFNNEIYPLYNSSLLVDYYDKLIQSLDEVSVYRHVYSTLAILLKDIYNFPDKSFPVFLFPHLINANTQEEIKSGACVFAVKDKNTVLIGLDGKQFSHGAGALNSHIQSIQELQSKGLLLFVNGLKGQGGNLSFQAKEITLYFLVIDPHTNIAETYFSFEEKLVSPNAYTCTALDALNILGFSDSMNQVIQFIKASNEKETSIETIGTKSDEFLMWKSQNQQFSTGAISPNIIYIGYTTTEEHIFLYFTDRYHIPKNSPNIYFREPLSWLIEDKNSQYACITHKGSMGIFAYTKLFNSNLSLCFMNNLTLLPENKKNMSSAEQHRTLMWLNMTLSICYETQLSNIDFLKDKTLILIFLSKDYAITVDNTDFLSNSNMKYVFCDALMNKNDILIRYVVDSEKLFEDIQNSKTRQPELTYFMELLEPLEKYSNQIGIDLKQQISQDSVQAKIVDTAKIKLDYHLSNKVVLLSIHDIYFTRAKKQIAEVCCEHQIEQGTYHGEDATQIIRKMQHVLVPDFEKHLAKYNQQSLHAKVLSHYAMTWHKVSVGKTKYFEQKSLSPEYQKEFERDLIENRDQKRRNLRNLQYLIESNLACSHNEENLECNDEDFYFLLAYVDWLVVFQDNSDSAHSFSESGLSTDIEVTSEFLVHTKPNPKYNEYLATLTRRKYETDTYFLLNDPLDRDFREKSLSAFCEDTGVNFKMLIWVIAYLKTLIVEKTFALELHPNVYSVEKEKVLHDFSFSNDSFGEGFELPQVEKAFDFMVLDISKLKENGKGQLETILPFWECKNRVNRFDVKPIICFGDDIIFSPVIMHALEEIWIHGIDEWFLPYEMGMPHLLDVAKSWKNRYESFLVTRIETLFLGKNFKVHKEVDFIKRFTKQGYPQNGDYDIIAISDSRKEIWLIEAKFIKKVASITEASSAQKNFVEKDKYLFKFQRRVSYFKDNIAKISKSFDADFTEYKVISYMVLNKVFVLLNYSEDIDFELISFTELEKILNCE